MKLQRFVAVTAALARSGKVPERLAPRATPSLIEYGDAVWEVAEILEGRAARQLRKRLKRQERRRRRLQPLNPYESARVDVHGKHRVLVRLTLSIQLGDWRHEPLYDTVTRG